LASNPQLKKSYATPALVRIDGRDLLLSQGADWLYAYDPKDGHEVWKFPYGARGFSLSSRAVFGHGMMFYCTGYARSEVQAVKLSATGATLAWKYAKGAPTMSSPLLVDDLLYFVGDSGGMFTCLDAKTGQEVYRQRLGGSHSSSPLFADGHIYLCDREGTTCVIAPGREYRELGRNTLPGRIMATPAAVGDSIYLRTDSALYRIGRK
jgi:outer membrane protein assembly factor BamB